MVMMFRLVTVAQILELYQKQLRNIPLLNLVEQDAKLFIACLILSLEEVQKLVMAQIWCKMVMLSFKGALIMKFQVNTKIGLDPKLKRT